MNNLIHQKKLKEIIMNKHLKHFRTLALAATFTAAALTGAANADSQNGSIKLLTAKFEVRQVVQVEVGDFHFKPGHRHHFPLLPKQIRHFC